MQTGRNKPPRARGSPNRWRTSLPLTVGGLELPTNQRCVQAVVAVKPGAFFAT
jgi:hypothetical protein